MLHAIGKQHRLNKAFSWDKYKTYLFLFSADGLPSGLFPYFESEEQVSPEIVWTELAFGDWLVSTGSFWEELYISVRLG